VCDISDWIKRTLITRTGGDHRVIKDNWTTKGQGSRSLVTFNRTPARCLLNRYDIAGRAGAHLDLYPSRRRRHHIRGRLRSGSIIIIIIIIIAILPLYFVRPSWNPIDYCSTLTALIAALVQRDLFRSFANGNP